jgi:hypothetical protein
MGRPVSRHEELSLIHYYPAHAGARAVFLVEARTRKEVRQIRELFDMVGHLAEVVPISHGSVMCYAVQTQDDTSLFGKVEWLLKTQFTFSIVERSYSDVTHRLVASLCEDTQTQMVELPDCGICGAVEPFPTRATVELKMVEEPLHLSYCARCAAKYAEEDPVRQIRGLIARDRRRLPVSAETPVQLMPDIVEQNPGWEVESLAIAG